WRGTVTRGRAADTMGWGGSSGPAMLRVTPGRCAPSPLPGESMTSLRTSSRAAALVAIGLGATLWVACSDRSADLPTGPTARPVFAAPDPHGIRAAVAAHERHTPALMRIPGVVGTAVGLLRDGKADV